MPLSREDRAIAEIACPTCGAPAGSPCVRVSTGRQLQSTHGPACCSARRAANQERRRIAGLAGDIQTPKGTISDPCPGCGKTLPKAVRRCRHCGYDRLARTIPVPPDDPGDSAPTVVSNPYTVAWVSRHEPIPSQLAALRSLFGASVRVDRSINSFENADQIIERYSRLSQPSEMVIVAPLSVCLKLIERGVKPLWPDMEEVPYDDPAAEVQTAGSGFRETGRAGAAYRFIRFRRLVGIEMNFEDME